MRAAARVIGKVVLAARPLSKCCEEFIVSDRRGQIRQKLIQNGKLDGMVDALEYVLGIYGLSTAVTLLVWLVIVAIRWVSGDRPHAQTPAKL